MYQVQTYSKHFLKITQNKHANLLFNLAASPKLCHLCRLQRSCFRPSDPARVVVLQHTHHYTQAPHTHIGIAQSSSGAWLHFPFPLQSATTANRNGSTGLLLRCRGWAQLPLGWGRRLREKPTPWAHQKGKKEVHFRAISLSPPLTRARVWCASSVWCWCRFSKRALRISPDLTAVVVVVVAPLRSCWARARLRGWFWAKRVRKAVQQSGSWRKVGTVGPGQAATDFSARRRNPRSFQFKNGSREYAFCFIVPPSWGWKVWKGQTVRKSVGIGCPKALPQKRLPVWTVCVCVCVWLCIKHRKIPWRPSASTICFHNDGLRKPLLLLTGKKLRHLPRTSGWFRVKPSGFGQDDGALRADFGLID